MNSRNCTSTTRSAGTVPSSRAVTERSSPSRMFSAKSAAASGIVAVVARQRTQPRDERRQRRDDPQRIAVRLHQQRVRVLGEQRAEAHRWPGDFSTHRCAGCFDCRCSRNMRCQRYAGAMSASCSSQVAYDGTRYCVGKIMLRKSDAVMRTHSCGSCAPIGCICWNPGRTRSTPASVVVDLRDARVGVVRRGLGRRNRLVDLPRERNARRRVLREQLVQDRRARAALADDHDRRHDVDADDLRMLLAVVDDPHAVAEVADELAADERGTQLVQRGFVLQARRRAGPDLRATSRHRDR